MPSSVARARQVPPRLKTRPPACPHCNGHLIDEPGAVRCLNCGRIYYFEGLGAEQLAFERHSGKMTVVSQLADRRTVGRCHRYAEWDTAFV